jgi:hypothetical protein
MTPSGLETADGVDEDGILGMPDMPGKGDRKPEWDGKPVK